jgi:triosephosphate isomerase
MAMSIRTPVIVLNVKAYAESAGEKGENLLKACEEAAEETGASIVICPQQVQLALLAKDADIPVFAQSVDAVEPGSQTGWVTLQGIKAVGAAGTLVNHSEHRLKMADIEWIVSKAKEMDLATCVCTNNVPVSMAAAAMGPDFVAVEPPELIGTGIPVSKADPEIVKNSVDEVKRVNDSVIVLCGAGITTGEDVKAAIELGSEGVLLASGVVKADDPKAALIDLTKGI